MERAELIERMEKAITLLKAAQSFIQPLAEMRNELYEKFPVHYEWNLEELIAEFEFDLSSVKENRLV